MAIVLSDGAPASQKALDAAIIPNWLLRHAQDQLVVLHGWSETKDLEKLTAIPQAVDQVAKSRVAAMTLNYKVEMVKVGGPPRPDSTPMLQATPTPTPTPSSPPKQGKAPRGKKDKNAAMESHEDIVAAPEESVAAQLAAYVSERCAHHKVDRVILGVGNAQQGKSIAIGSVCKELVREHRANFNLFCLKPTGPSVRPNAPMRTAVLVIPGSDLAHLRFVLSLANADKGDRVGVMIIVNNGKEKDEEEEDLDYTLEAAVGEDGLETASETTRRCQALFEEYNLSEAGEEHASVEGATTIDTFMQINHVTLDPSNNNPTPTVDTSGLQLIKAVGSMKVDYLALPPRREGNLDSFTQLALAAPKPHILLPRD